MAEEETPPGGDGKGGKGPDWRNLERARDKALDEASKWKNLALQGLVEGAGFKSNDPVVGLVMKEFNTDELDPEDLKPDSFVKFAEKFNVKPPEGTGGDGGDGGEGTTAEQIAALQAQQQNPGQTPPPDPNNPTDPNALTPVQQYQHFQSPADQLLTAATANAQPPQPTTPQARADAAEQRGDFATSFGEKFQATRQFFNGGQGTAPAPTGPVNPATGLPTHTPTQ